MKMTEISIRNFKSIKEVTISNIENLNILVGKNNTGKSSVFDAIRLLQDAANREMHELYDYRKGFENISFGRDKGDVEGDEEGLTTAWNFGKNIAFLIRKLKT